jgi:hypothetical protein
MSLTALTHYHTTYVANMYVFLLTFNERSAKIPLFLSILTLSRWQLAYFNFSVQPGPLSSSILLSSGVKSLVIIYVGRERAALTTIIAIEGHY